MEVDKPETEQSEVEQAEVEKPEAEESEVEGSAFCEEVEGFPGWYKVFHEISKQFYFWNLDTNETTWQLQSQSVGDQ